MAQTSQPDVHASSRLLRCRGFTVAVLRDFRRNQGVLLAGAVAYHTLLSIVPLMGLLLVGLSHVVEEQALLASVREHLDLLVPAQAGPLTDQVAHFLSERHLVGWIGILFLVFFSTLAFTVLENAMSVIFYHRVAIQRRHFLVSATIPFLFIFLVGLGLLLVTFVSGALQTVEGQEVALFGWTWQLTGLSAAVLYALGFLGLVILLTSLYLVMPVGRIALRHALVGGAVAALLWEGARHLLVWYFSTLSLVNLIYGSFATVIVILLGFEVASIILLLGAQVIAGFERGGCGEEAAFNT